MDRSLFTRKMSPPGLQSHCHIQSIRRPRELTYYFKADRGTRQRCPMGVLFFQHYKGRPPSPDYLSPSSNRRQVSLSHCGFFCTSALWSGVTLLGTLLASAVRQHTAAANAAAATVAAAAFPPTTTTPPPLTESCALTQNRQASLLLNSLKS